MNKIEEDTGQNIQGSELNDDASQNFGGASQNTSPTSPTFNDDVNQSNKSEIINKEDSDKVNSTNNAQRKYRMNDPSSIQGDNRDKTPEYNALDGSLADYNYVIPDKKSLYNTKLEREEASNNTRVNNKRPNTLRESNRNMNNISNEDNTKEKTWDENEYMKQIGSTSHNNQISNNPLVPNANNKNSPHSHSSYPQKKMENQQIAMRTNASSNKSTGYSKSITSSNPINTNFSNTIANNAGNGMGIGSSGGTIKEEFNLMT
eukprot:CAMPEP_0170523770 /NCGR_PEP_ID=MMETSP0209-20121228/9204_1 /TAXON_ID=665100 ORGANISM="Litonotus pictus, Strain P1" /NCGR_SAMPLE_ID=MMETSP0209 /ASSEMBLY_ACC=CAM_ASM_000301 /LENGTH=260 /DNA_ID=CAMNT_0010812055 /DNA_START=2553 /DNA_END=3336 /DNA_ORIENTATION=+